MAAEQPPRSNSNARRSEYFTDEPNLVNLIQSYRWSPIKTIFFIVFSLLSLGLFPALLWLWRRGPSEIIRRTHIRCKLEKATVFIVKVTFQTKPLICRPLVVTCNSPLSKNGIVLTPVNRIQLTFFRKVFSTLSTDRFIEFVNEEDSAAAYKVHTHQNDNLRAIIDIGPSAGLFIWNVERRLFQRLPFPPYYSNKQSSFRLAAVKTTTGLATGQQQQQGASTPTTTDCFEDDEPNDFIVASAMDADYFQQELTVNDDKFCLELYEQNMRKTWLCYLLSLLTCGLLSAIFVWKPSWRLAAIFDRLNFGDSRKATHVKIADSHITDNVWIRPLWLSTRKGVLLDDKTLSPKGTPWNLVWRFFVFESMPFVLDIKSNRFSAGPILYDELVTNAYNQRRASEPAIAGTPITPSAAAGNYDIRHPWARRALCGFNVTPVPLTPIWLIFWREAFSPLYIFQVACCVMWYTVEYTIYATCLVTFAFCTISWSVYMTYSNERAVWHAVVGKKNKSNSNLSGVAAGAQGRTIRRNTLASSRLQKTSNDDEEKVLIAEQGDAECGFATAIPPKMLVPGDVVFLGKSPDGRLPEIPADLVLLEGSCLVDESMLSGEVTPVTKFPCPNPRRDKPLERNMLHSGTKLVCISSGAATAMVTTIGFCTNRGRLVRSVLRPTKADVRFTVETIKFLGAMAIVGIIGLTYTIIIRVLRGEDFVLILIMSGVLAAVVVPPQLSVGLTISLVVAQLRLKARRIFCTNPKSITPTGSVDLVCFDKTGTLTEESVSLKSVICVGFKQPPEFQVIDEEQVERIPYFQEDVTQTFELCAASCNSLTILQPQTTHTPPSKVPPTAHEPIGDPIDLELFHFSQFKLLPSGVFYSLKRPTLRVEILKNFGFSPERRSACVVVKVTDLLASTEEAVYVFVKGAPEHVLANCIRSTIPIETNDLMAEATHHGLRLILLAAKRIDPRLIVEILDQATNQDDVEAGLELCGISFFENCVKPESRPTIAKLQAAKLRSIIITGDDVRTAVATAREVGIVGGDVLIVQEKGDQSTVSAAEFIRMCSLVNVNKRLDVPSVIAITEDSWQIFRRESVTSLGALSALHALLERGAVFARFRPEQKAEVVAEYRQRFGFIVAMIGDGANDCCALKAADVGVALTEAEASVASAFTCKNRNVSPVIDILKEGRCSLISTFGLFGVMVSYSCVQFSSMCILYWIQSNFADFQFLYLDLFLLTTLSLVFPLVPAFHRALSDRRPHRRLLCFGQIAPILVHNFVNLAFQLFVFHFVSKQPWFLPYNIPQAMNVNREYNSFESYSVFTVSIFQYVWSALIFSRGAPFRSRFYTSGAFSAHLIALLIANHAITIYLPTPLRELIQIFPPPSLEYRLIMVMLSYINLASSFICVRAVEELAQVQLLQKLKRRFCLGRNNKRTDQHHLGQQNTDNPNEIIL